MILVFLNGQPKELSTGISTESSTESSTEISLTHAIAVWEYTETNFAVAVNQQFVPHSKYDKTVLNDGDHIEVIAPIQGG